MKIFVLLLILFSFQAHAGSCQEIALTDDRNDYDVFASATKGLHLQFSEPVKLGILSNNKLWKSHSKDALPHHYWIIAKNTSTKDNEVGATMILESGKVVNLVVKQKMDAPSCLVIKDETTDSLFFADNTRKEAFVNNSVANTPKPLITSSYHFDSSLVRSAYDDSRFTHVQLNGFSSGKSLYSVVALSGEKKRVISNPTFDSMTNTYTLSGIHDVLLFEGEGQSFEVKRL